MSTSRKASSPLSSPPESPQMPRVSGAFKAAAKKKEKKPTKKATKNPKPTVQPTIRSKRKAHIAPEHDKDALETLEKERRKRLKDEAGLPRASSHKSTSGPHLPTDIIIVKPTKECGQPSPHTTLLSPSNRLAQYLATPKPRAMIQMLGMQSMMPAPSFSGEREYWAFARWFVQPAATTVNEQEVIFGRGTVLGEEFAEVEKGMMKTVPVVQMAWFETYGQISWDALVSAARPTHAARGKKVKGKANTPRTRRCMEVFRSEDGFFLRWQYDGPVLVNGEDLTPRGDEEGKEFAIGPMPPFAVVAVENVSIFWWRKEGVEYLTRVTIRNQEEVRKKAKEVEEARKRREEEAKKAGTPNTDWLQPPKFTNWQTGSASDQGGPPTKYSATGPYNADAGGQFGTQRKDTGGRYGAHGLVSDGKGGSQLGGVRAGTQLGEKSGSNLPNANVQSVQQSAAVQDYFANFQHWKAVFEEGRARHLKERDEDPEWKNYQRKDPEQKPKIQQMKIPRPDGSGTEILSEEANVALASVREAVKELGHEFAFLNDGGIMWFKNTDTTDSKGIRVPHAGVANTSHDLILPLLFSQLNPSPPPSAEYEEYKAAKNRLQPGSAMSQTEWQTRGQLEGDAHIVLVVCRRKEDEPKKVDMLVMDSFKQNVPADRIHDAVFTVIRKSGWWGGLDMAGRARDADEIPVLVEEERLAVPHQDTPMTCGIHTILNGWVYMMNLPAINQGHRIYHHARADKAGELNEEAWFMGLAREVINLALAGHMDTLTIQAFMNVVGFCQLQDRKDAVKAFKTPALTDDTLLELLDGERALQQITAPPPETRRYPETAIVKVMRGGKCTRTKALDYLEKAGGDDDEALGLSLSDQ